MHENPQHAWSAAIQAMESSQQAQGDISHRMRQTRRVFLPVSTALSHTGGHRDDGAPVVDRGPWMQAAAWTNHKPPSSCTLTTAFVASFLSTCLLVLACAGSAICRFLLVGVCSARVRAQQRPTRNVSQVAGAFQAARAAQLDDLPHQAAAIEFSSSLCAVEKRLGAASEATGMSGLGQVGGPSLPPMCPSGGVIAGNAQTACAAVATPTHRCTRRWERCV
jgi:hypothetical protein